MTAKLATPAHWVRKNDTARQPRCWIIFDTESRVVSDDRGPTQVWRCGVAVHAHRKEGSYEYRPDEWSAFEQPSELWDWVESKVRKNQRTVIVAHNLAYDLRIADAFDELARRGWRLDRIRLDGDQTSVRWRRGSSTILGVDSMSWFPVGLEVIGNELGVKKLRLPHADDSDDAWLARCRRDVEILSTAWLRLVRWLHDIDAGTWQPTGAAQSWTVWRHKFMTHKVLVDDDEPLRELERASTWTGRCEVWRHGRLVDGPFTEWDYRASYMQIAHDCELPNRVVGQVDRPRWKDVERWMTTSCVLATVEVTTEVPVLPARSAHGIYWPTGTFSTTVWSPELVLARGVASQLSVSSAVVYSRAPILRAFAEWCLPLALDEAGDGDPIVRRVTKHWSRALIGRFGVRYRVWEPFGEAAPSGVILGDGFDAETEERFRVLSFNGESLRESGILEGENAIPSVMGYVMSEARSRLWAAMMAAGIEHVVYVDTDGLVVDEEGSARLAAAGLVGLRRKASYRSVEVLGPRQCVFGAEVRIAGVPRRARKVGARTWEGEVWPALSTSLGRGDLANVRTAMRRTTVRGTDHRRLHLPKGVTAPILVG